jgi:hypothetical protein
VTKATSAHRRGEYVISADGAEAKHVHDGQRIAVEESRLGIPLLTDRAAASARAGMA